MTTTNWHRFRENEDGDDECTRCHVQVTLEATMTFTLPCPAGDCSSAKNPDRGCAFVPRRGGPCACLYCGRAGHRDGDDLDGDLDTTTDAPDDVDVDPDDFLADTA